MAEFGIQVKIQPDTEVGRRKVEADLKATEEAAAKAAAAMKAFDDDAVAALKSIEAQLKKDKAAADALAKAFEDDAMAVIGSLKKQQAANAELSASFGKLERATLSVVRAEHEYAEAEKTVNAAVKAGIATQAQANAILTEKAKAFEQVTVKAEQHNKTFAESVRGWIKGKGAAAEVIDGFGKLGMAMGGINQAVQIGKFAWDGLSAAIEGTDAAVGKLINKTSSPEALKAFIMAGGLRGLPQGLQDKFAAASERSTFQEDHAWDKAGGTFAQLGLDDDARLNNAIDALNDLTAKGLELERQKSEEITNQNNSIAKQNLMKRANEQAALIALIAAKAEAKAEREKAAARGPKRLSDYDSMAADMEGWEWSAVTEVNKAIAATRVWADELQRAKQIWDVNDERPDILVDDGRDPEAIVRLAESGNRLAGQFEDAGIDRGAPSPLAQWEKDAIALAETFEGPLKGAIDDFAGRMLDMARAWDFSAESMKEWARSFAASMAEAAARALILWTIMKLLGTTQGSAGGFLTSIFGGATTPATGSTSRQAPGDPFGGGAGGPRPIFTDAIARQAPGGGPGGGAAAPIVNVVMVADLKQAAREFAKSPENTRIITSAVQQNSGAIAAASGRR